MFTPSAPNKECHWHKSYFSFCVRQSFSKHGNSTPKSASMQDKTFENMNIQIYNYTNVKILYKYTNAQKYAHI